MIAVGVGSNINPTTHVLAGLRRLDVEAGIAAMSPFWTTAPIDRPDQADYVNGVVLVRSEEPAPLRALLHSIEANEARIRTEDAYAARTLDLDIIALQRHDGWHIEDEAKERPWLRHGLALLLGGTPDHNPPGPVVPWATLAAVRAQSA